MNCFRSPNRLLDRYEAEEQILGTMTLLVQSRPYSLAEILDLLRRLPTLVDDTYRDRRWLSGSPVAVMVLGVIRALASCCHEEDLRAAAREIAGDDDVVRELHQLADKSKSIDKLAEGGQLFGVRIDVVA